MKKLATSFSPLFLLYCHNQVAKIVTYISDYSVYYKNAFEKKKLLLKIVVPKLQETLLYDPKKDAQLEPCIAHSVPTFQHCRKMI